MAPSNTVQADEKLSRVDTEHIEANPNEKELYPVETLGIDLANRDAEKGDDSDGKVNWTTKQILATLFLCGLYVGMLPYIAGLIG